MDTSNPLVDENNKTLAFMVAKDYPNALQSSLSALSYQQRVTGTFMNGQLQRPPQHDTSSATLDECMMMLLSFEPPVDESYSDTRQQQPFLFDQGILLPPTITDWMVITPALIFNSALAHHLSPDNGSPLARLQRAKRLYELAYGASGQLGNDSILFRFAIINNLAIIESQMGNWETSQLYIQGLMSTYMVFVDQERTLQPRYLQGFLSNLSTISIYARAA